MGQPKDGYFSWIILLCVFMSQCMLGGICLNGGVFYIVFKDAFGSGTVETSWLCSLPITLWFFASPIRSFLTNTYGYRKCAFIGGLIAATGISIGYFATNMVVLFVSHGIITGLGFGISYTGCMSALNIYFDKYKTIALGLASIGHNIGMVVYADIIVRLEGIYGWRGMMLINGALTLNLCAFAAFMMPIEFKQNQSLGLKAECTDENHVKKKKKGIDTSVFRKLSFVCFCASSLFISIGQGVYILHLPSYSLEAGFTEKDFSLLWMVNGISTVVGKVIYSFAGQHPKVSATFLYAVSITFTGIFMGITPMFLTKSGLFVTTAFIGFFYCVTGALIQAVIYDIVGYNRFADGIGMALPFRATGNLIGGPLAGILLATTGSYSSSFYLAGVSMVGGSFILVQPIFHHRRRAKAHKSKDIYIIHEKNITNGNNEAIAFIEKTPIKGNTLISNCEKIDLNKDITNGHAHHSNVHILMDGDGIESMKS